MQLEEFRLLISVSKRLAVTTRKCWISFIWFSVLSYTSDECSSGSSSILPQMKLFHLKLHSLYYIANFISGSLETHASDLTLYYEVLWFLFNSQLPQGRKAGLHFGALKLVSSDVKRFEEAQKCVEGLHRQI